MSEKVELAQKALDTQLKNAEISNTIAKAIEVGVGNIQLNQQTINQKVIREIQTNTVYADCHTTPVGMQLIKDAIANKGQPTPK